MISYEGVRLWRPPGELFPLKRPIAFHQFRTDQGERVLVVGSEAALDDVVLVGMNCMIADGKATPAERRLFAAMHLLFRCRSRYMREPLADLDAIWRDPNWRDDWMMKRLAEKLGTDGVSARELRPRKFRRAFGEALAGLGQKTATHVSGLPASVVTMFDLPPWQANHREAAFSVVRSIADRLAQWATKRARGPMPHEAVSWLHDRLKHRAQQPIHTREDGPVKWAVAMSTYRALRDLYPLGMAVLRERMHPPLTEVERTLFDHGHMTSMPAGVPLLSIPQRYRDLIEPALEAYFEGKTGCDAVARAIHGVFCSHAALKSQQLVVERARRMRHFDRQSHTLIMWTNEQMDLLPAADGDAEYDWHS